MAPDPFAGLHPNGIERLLVAWHHLEVPGPPPAYQLAGDELTHPDPGIRFARRTIQRFDCAGGRESLALVDKALPHSLFDLMLTEVSARPRSTPMDVEPVTGRTLWRTGLNFVRFCSDPRVIRDFRLAGGELHLALNCDPHTLDRESVQAAKQFHLHLLYWPRPALIPLVGAERLGLVGDRQLRRQALDPVSFLGADLIAEHLAALDLSLPGARVLGPDPAAVLDGTRPLGCLIALPGWAVLAEPAFEDLVRRVHGLLADLSADLLHAFTGRRDIPAPWHRHPLRPGAEILSRLADLPYSPRTRAGLDPPGHGPAQSPGPDRRPPRPSRPPPPDGSDDPQPARLCPESPCPAPTGAWSSAD